MDTPPIAPPILPSDPPVPSTHRYVYAVIAILSVIIIAGALWVFWPKSAVTPERTPTPSAPMSAGPGEHCGGNTANALQCRTGYHCAPSPGSTLPFGDVGGTCVADVTYRNTDYGLLVTLPDDWRGFSVISRQWQAVDVASGTTAASGPQIVLRHPLWTQTKPYEDLPVMVFTHEQWAHVGHEGANEWSVSAAPIPPSALASNSLYVFALPARYNYDFAEGFQELDDAIRAGAVTAFEP